MWKNVSLILNFHFISKFIEIFIIYFFTSTLITDYVFDCESSKWMFLVVYLKVEVIFLIVYSLLSIFKIVIGKDDIQLQCD